MRIAYGSAAVLAASMVLGAGRSAHADSGFGHAGELDISADQPLVAGSLAAANAGLSGALPLPTTITPFGLQVFSASDGGGSDTAFSIAPAVDYFVSDNISIGLQVLFGIVASSPPQGASGTTTTLYGIAPQFGYHLRLNDKISFWPKLFFGFAGSSGGGSSASEGTLGVFAPFLFHLAPHFYAGIGPDFSTELFANQSSGNGGPSVSPAKITTFGVMATFGGWFTLGGG